MKVMLTFGGMPPYLKALLDRIQSADGIDITAVLPSQGKGATIGRGVKTVEGGSFRTLHIPERRMCYGKAGFPDLPALVRGERPDLLVLGWPYFLQVSLQPSLRRAMREADTRLLIREIPFQTPPYGQIRAWFSRHPMYDENMRLLSRGPLFLLRQWITARLRRACYARACGTLNYSTAALDILPSYGVPPSRIHVTFNTTDTDTLWREREAAQDSPPLLPPAPNRLLHIGRLVAWKRTDLLIRAFADILPRHPDTELLIVGDGPELPCLRELAASLRLTAGGWETPTCGGLVRFVGAVHDPRRLGACMSESDIYVLAGMGGLSINDAMAYGLPVVCSVCDSTERDLLTDGVSGLFFREGDLSSLSSCLDRLLSSPDLRRRMGQAAEQVIREKINIRTVAQRYADAFRNSVDEETSQRGNKRTRGS